MARFWLEVNTGQKRTHICPQALAVLFCFNKKSLLQSTKGHKNAAITDQAYSLCSSPALCTFSRLRSTKCVKAGLLSVMISVCIKGLIQTSLKWNESPLIKSKFLIATHFLLSEANVYIYRSVGPNCFLYISKFQLNVSQMNRLPDFLCFVIRK